LAKHRTDLTRGLPLPSTWVNALMEFVGSSHANFRVSQITDTAIFVSAGTGNDQVAIAIGGKWRFNTATVTAVHPGGAAGTYDAFVTAHDNDTSAVDPADATDYSFGLVIRARVSGSPDPPPATGATALSRRVARVDWNGSAITDVTPVPPELLAAAGRRAWQTVMSAGIVIPAANAGTSRWFDAVRGAGIASGGTATSMPNVFPYRTTRPGAAGTDDQDIPGLTPEWRLSLAWIVNTNPATTFKVGLVDASALATPTTGANLVMPTLAPSFSSPLSTFSVTLDATSGSNGQFWSTPVQETLGLFTIGHNYMLAVQIGTMAANSYLGLDVKLQRRFR
jgi:hypothetical protein